jgi:hypothetical protein
LAHRHPQRLSRRAAIAKRIAPTANQANSYPSYVTANYAYTAEDKLELFSPEMKTTFTPGCLPPLNVGAGTTDKGHWRDKSAGAIAK